MFANNVAVEKNELSTYAVSYFIGPILPSVLIHWGFCKNPQYPIHDVDNIANIYESNKTDKSRRRSIQS
jgi:hypothetical protein